MFSVISVIITYLRRHIKYYTYRVFYKISSRLGVYVKKTLPLLFEILPCGNVAFSQRQINVLLGGKVEPVEIIIQMIFFREVLIGLTLCR